MKVINRFSLRTTLHVSLAFLGLTLATFSFTGCKKEGCTDPAAITYDPDAVESNAKDCEYPILSLDINFVAGNQDFALDQVFDVNGVATSFTTAQFYLSEVGVGENDNFEVPGTYLLVKPNQPPYEVGEVTAGHKHMLRFGVGVDTTVNFLDPTNYEQGHPLAPQSPSMHWNWNSGYIFIRLEGQIDANADGTPETLFECHVGGKMQYSPLVLEVHHEANSVDSRIPVKVDVAKFFDGIDLTTDNITHTMDNMPLAMAIVNNLDKVFSVE